MKVLFAVSNEEISETIVKKYQKVYKEIISYKNVYYFNAILKEIQKDKSYDRIVISEDLEAFSNTQYDQIDKFIFDKLDSISDEASNIRGEDIPIILICSDRRTKSEQMIVKLFGIGVYNAILGNDRNIEEVCRLINRPRLKKEAKQYYKIDTEDVGYQAENENDVSEVEIQNILAHYKKIGKNEEQYVVSFDNIASQYNDIQLKIICKFLPLNVRAVLEEKSPKYQQLMAFSPSVAKQRKTQQENIPGISSKLLKADEKISSLNRPVIVPSEVKLDKVTKLTRTKKQEQNPQPIESIQPVNNTKTEESTMPGFESYNPVEEKEKAIIPGFENNKEPEQEKEEPLMPGFESYNTVEEKEEAIIPGFENNKEPEQEKEEPIIPGFESYNTVEEESDLEEPVIEEPKRKRGRPRKNPPVEKIESAVPKKRGRPRKNPLPESIAEEKPNPYEGLEGFKNNNYNPPISDLIPEAKNNDDEEPIIPGFENNKEPEQEEEEPLIPGFESYNPVEEKEEPIIPGFENNKEPEQEEKPLIPGFESYNPVEEKEEPIIPGFENNKEPEQEKEEPLIPGFESYNPVEEKEEPIIPGFENNKEPEQEKEEPIIPGFENNNIPNQQQEPITPNFENYNYNNIQPNNTQNNIQSEPINMNPVMPQFNTNYNNYNNVQNQYIDISNFLTPDKKVVSFVGTSKNGTSFIVNNLATYTSSLGIKTAVLDMTKNRNAYYIYTKNDEDLINIASNSIPGLMEGKISGINENANLTIFTAVPNDHIDVENAGAVLQTLVSNYSLVLIDCDFDTPEDYFRQSQEIYLVQSLDVLTIQPLTAFLRDMQERNAIDQRKIRIILNKCVNIRGINEKIIIGGMSCYNDPSMSFNKDLFDRDTVKYITIPFEEDIYIKYLKAIIDCNVSIKGYSKSFMQVLKQLQNMIYPMSNMGKRGYQPPKPSYNSRYNG